MDLDMSKTTFKEENYKDWDPEIIQEHKILFLIKDTFPKSLLTIDLKEKIDFDQALLDTEDVTKIEKLIIKNKYYRYRDEKNSDDSYLRSLAYLWNNRTVLKSRKKIKSRTYAILSDFVDGLINKK